MSSVHQALRASHMSAYVWPRIPRFFTPVPRFWYVLREAVNSGIQIVECGSGNGDLLEDAKRWDVTLTGWDVRRAEGQSILVGHGDATILEWSPTCWPLICRPSHDGFANEIIEKARTQGATTWYVGLSTNYQKDISYYRNRVRARCVGLEGEHLYEIKPKGTSL